MLWDALVMMSIGACFDSSAQRTIRMSPNEFNTVTYYQLPQMSFFLSEAVSAHSRWLKTKSQRDGSTGSKRWQYSTVSQGWVILQSTRQCPLRKFQCLRVPISYQNLVGNILAKLSFSGSSKNRKRWGMLFKRGKNSHYADMHTELFRWTHQFFWHPVQYIQ